MELKGFIKSREVAEVLLTGLHSGQNVVLHGPGGYGKSEMALEFLRAIGARNEQVQVKSLSTGTLLDDLFGGVNIRALSETGELLYNVEKSVFSTPYLILEEAFDAPPRVLEGLKDVLTSGYIRNGLQSYEVKTKFIIVCTNRSKSELATDESSRALMERFPLSLRVEWDSHTLNDYRSLIETVFNHPMDDSLDAVLGYILDSIKEDESARPPAPRTVVRMHKILRAAGVRALRFLDGVPNISRAIEYLGDYAHWKRKYDEYYDEVDDLNDKIHNLGDEVTLSLLRKYNDKLGKLKHYAEKVNREVNFPTRDL